MSDFADELCGITQSEVAGLLSKVMRREFHVYTNTVGSKRVRKFTADLLGIRVNVTEVDSSFVSAHSMKHMNALFGTSSEARNFRDVEYHVENVEWEFSVIVNSTNSHSSLERGDEVSKLAGQNVVIRYPWFEGDEEDYRRDMSMIRLLGLSEEQEEGVML